MKAKQQPARDVGEQFRLLVESIEDYAIFLLDPQGNVSSWNPGAERIKGYRAEEIIGRHFSVFYPSEDVDRGKPQSELQVAARDGRFEEEGWRLRKGGTRFWADVVLTAIRDERGRVIGFGKVTRDLTERKWGEEEKFGKMFRLCPVPLAIVTLAEGRFVEANEAYVRLVGYPREELIGRTVAEVNIHPQAEQRTALMKAIESGQKVRNVEGVLRSKSGEERSVLHSAELIEVGENPCMVTAVQDVTEIKRLEDAVREASTPVLRVREGLLILPLIGVIDSHRARQLTEQLLKAIRRERARAVVIDLTGVPSMNLTIANHLIQTVDASRLLGARVILTGLSSRAAESLVSIGVNLGQFVALGDLQSGIEEAEQWLKAPWKPSLPTATAPDGEDFDQANFPAGTNP